MWLGVLAFVVMAADAPFLDQGPLVLRWAILSAAAPLALLWMPRLEVSIIHVLIAGLIGWAVITLAWSPDTAVALDAVWKMIVGALVFCIGHRTSDLRKFYIGAALGLVPSSILAIAQVIAEPHDGWNVPAGLFGNSNMMGEAASLVLVGLIVRDAWAFIPAVVPAFIFAQARGAILAAVVVVAATSRAWLIALSVVVAMLFVLPINRSMIDTTSLGERFIIWHDLASGLSLRGYGLGSFEIAFAEISSRPKHVALHAHNDVLELVFELGAVGTLLAVAIFGLIMLQALPGDRPVLVALLIEAIFGFSLHMPATAFIGAVVAGHAARGWPVLRQRERVGGVALQARA